MVTINALEEKVPWYETSFGFKKVGRDEDDPETELMIIDLIPPENLKLLAEYDDIVS